jgi:hypothetical protein
VFFSSLGGRHKEADVEQTVREDEAVLDDAESVITDEHAEHEMLTKTKE